MTITAIGSARLQGDMADIYMLPPTVSPKLHFQPVFRADGRVFEYALSPSAASQSGSLTRASTLRQLIDFSERGQRSVRFSLDRPFSHGNEQTVAQELGMEMRRALALGPVMDDARTLANRFQQAYSNDRILFTLPWIGGEGAFARFMNMFPDFNVHARTRLVPHFNRGSLSDFSELHVVGVRVRLPEKHAESSALQSRFLAFLDFATNRSLDVLVSDIDDIAAFNWLREFPGVSFQGNALSTPLSGELLKAWWAQQPDWQAFTFGTKTAQSDWTARFDRLTSLG